MGTAQECYELFWANPECKTTKQQLPRHLPPISKTIQIRWTRHARHCWRNKDGPLHMDIPVLASQQEPTKNQLCTETGCSLEDLSGVMDDRDELWERVKEIHANSTTWWWGWWYIYSILSINKYTPSNFFVKCLYSAKTKIGHYKAFFYYPTQQHWNCITKNINLEQFTNKYTP